MNKILLVALFAASCGLASCTKDKSPAPQQANSQDTTTTPVSDCDSTKVLYCNKIKKILTDNCISCHVAGGTGTGDFTTYLGIKDKVTSGSLRLRTLTFMDMPPSGPLSNADTTIISQWLAAGAPEK